MKKKPTEIRLYNVLFPTWFLLYLFPSWLIPAMLAGNFIIDSLVFFLTARWQRLDNPLVLWKRVILRIWLFGFASDILGALLNLVVYALQGVMQSAGLLDLSVWNPMLFPAATITALPGVLLAGWLIYWFNRKFTCPRIGIDPATTHKLCLAFAIVTAPYAMLIPLYG